VASAGLRADRVNDDSQSRCRPASRDEDRGTIAVVVVS
jgi:hypothetical protein